MKTVDSDTNLQGACDACGKAIRKRNRYCRECFAAGASRAPATPCGNTKCSNAARYRQQYCSAECMPTQAGTFCSKCGGPCPKRRVVCQACLGPLIVRSESRREARRKAKSVVYRRPDKAAKIAELMVLQCGRCAACQDEVPLFLDHNHATGEARRLLCRNCNVALGMMKECPSRIRALLSYAETYV